MAGVRRSEPLRNAVVPRWTPFAVAGALAVFVVIASWFAGPGLFALTGEAKGVVVEAEVTGPAPCTGPSPHEAIRIPQGGHTLDATLTACGHNQGEKVKVMLPDEHTGKLTVDPAEFVTGANDLVRPAGLALLTLSCAAGAAFVHLLQRTPART